MKKCFGLLSVFFLISLACQTSVPTPRPTLAAPLLLTPFNAQTHNQTTQETPILQCTPPLCQPGESLACSGASCPGGCGTICVKATQIPLQPTPATVNHQGGYIDSPNGGCAVFPADNPWNRDVSKDALDPNSNNYINFIMKSAQHLHADFGSDLSWGFPYVVVPANQPMLPINFTAYGDESDPGPYPVPLDAPIEGGSDQHVLVVHAGECKLYELYHAARSGNGWNADSGAVFDLNSNNLRPEGWTSADAAGLPIFPGLVRYDEVTAGEIQHALRFTVQTSQKAYIHPATHWASSVTDPNAPPMGLRLRMKADYDISWMNGQARVVADALKKYGMIVADNGSSWFISGARDARWNNEDLDQLKKVPGTAFEVVQSGPLVKP
jgi:hypothetical protein